MEKEIIYKLNFSKDFSDDLIKIRKSGQKKALEKIDSFLDEIEKHPTAGTGQVEPLKGYGERSVYSRRIDKKHRLVYEVFEDEKRVEILACYGHYE